MRSVKTLILGLVFAAAVPGLHAQATGAAQQVRKTAEDAAKASGQTPKPAGQPANGAKPAAPAASAASKPAAQAPLKSAPPASSKATPSVATKQPVQVSPPAKSATLPGGKPAAQTPVQSQKAAASPKPAVQAPTASPKHPAKPTKSAGKGRKTSARKPGQTKPAAGTPSGTIPGPALPIIARRDPFESMIGREAGANRATGPTPPGIRGLQVSTLRLDGVVRAPNGMIAVVSNPQSRTYFLREGDQLYDGRVEKIDMEGVSFHEVGKDAFGKPVERQVNKRIYASAGEQQ